MSRMAEADADRVELLFAAAQEFVDRCERGEIRSKYTYNKFKTILAMFQCGDDCKGECSGEVTGSCYCPHGDKS